METIIETLATPVLGSYDVIVCGGGPAGAAAAIAAGRTGAKTLLLESEQCLGGMWTSGYVNPLFDAENKGGLMREIRETLTSRGVWGGFRDICFQYEYMKRLLDELCEAAGVTVLFGTSFSRTLTEGDRVTGVIAENLAGRAAYLAHTVIDATGDAAVAASAGAEILVGDDAGRCQSMTLMFLVGNLNPKYIRYEGLMFFSHLKAAFEKEGLGHTANFNSPYIIPIPGTSYAAVQMSHMYGVDPLSPLALSRAVAEGRRQMIEAFEALRSFDPDFAELELLTSAPRLGVRESRRIVGDYILTVEDMLEGRSFEDEIATVTFNIDIHQNGSDVQICRKVKPYGIPLRCLIPRGKEGLLVAGRAISGTHDAMASYRVTGDCVPMGEAAGIVAALAAADKCGVRDIQASLVRDRMR